MFNERSGTVIAVALTSQDPRAGCPLTLEVLTGPLPNMVALSAVARVGLPLPAKQLEDPIVGRVRPLEDPIFGSERPRRVAAVG